MKRLINLGHADPQTEASQGRASPVTEPRASQAIESLRHRLVAGGYGDSVEVKAAILGEMLYCCYAELQKQRYL
jgi:hypothetical protein